MHFFSKLNINQKLWLYLVIPCFSLVLFGLNSIYSQHKHLQENLKISYAVALSKSYAQLVKSLQQERGLSAGSLHSSEFFKIQLSNQRLKTDALIIKLDKKLNEKNKLSQSQYHHANIAIKQLSNLSSIRQQVDEFSEDEYYDYYSQLNTQLINAASILYSTSNVSVYSSLESAYINSLWLGEFSGQERAIVTIFSSQNVFDSTDYKNLTVLVTAQNSILRRFNNSSPDKYKAELEQLLNDKVFDDIQRYRNLFTYQVQKDILLASIFKISGFDGLVHNFKNYLLRGTPIYAEQAKQKAYLAQNQIKHFIDDNKQFIKSDEHLKNLLHTLDLYGRKVDLITQLREENRSIDEIDRMVAINDQPFVDAIKWFNFDKTDFNAEQWWSTSTNRINRIHSIGVKITTELEQLIEHDKQQLQHRLVFIWCILISILLISFWIGVKIKSRLVNEIKQLSDFMRASQHNLNVPRLNISGDDEIAKMQQAFYDLLDLRDENERELRLASEVFYHAHEGISITDTNGVIIDVNPAFSTITGYSREYVIGKNPRVLQSGKHDSEFYTQMWESLKASGFWQGDICNQNKSGALVEESLTILALQNDKNETTHYIGMFIDITERKRKLEQFKEMAYYDQLTKLPNRSLLNERFKLAQAYCNREKGNIAVCYIDLDKFKPVNDIYGHDVGDLLLVEFAARLQSCLRDQDTAARIGGDEFVVLLSGSKNSKFEAVLNRLSNAIVEPFILNGHQIEIYASIGVALYPEHGNEFDALIKKADIAMYQAKADEQSHHKYFDDF